MKKLSTVLLGLGLFVSSALYAAEANKSTTQQATHMGDHMHEGKMMNHMNMNGMSDEEMKKMHEDMANEKTKNGMSDEEMKKMGHK